MTSVYLPRWFAVFVVLVLASGCRTSGPSADSPLSAEDLPEAFSTEGTSPLSSRWWESFEDELLNQLMDQALRGNFQIREFRSRVAEAEAVARVQVSDRFPEVNLEASARREDSERDEPDRFFAGLGAEFELDLWGRLDDLADAERLQAEATAEELQTAAITLSAETALARMQGLAARGGVMLLQDQVKDNTALVDSLTQRFRAGQAERVDVLRQEQLLLETRRLLTDARADVRVLSHQLAVLTGNAPGEFQGPEDTELPAVPELPATGIPLETLTRRPDVRAAWLQVLSADREVAAAISNRFPRISISASYGGESQDVSDFVEEWLWTLAGNLTAPLFDGGERRAEVDRAGAVLEQRLAAYGQTLLEAMQEVEDALVREQQQADQVQDLITQRLLASETLQQLELSYQNGVASFLDVLSARTQLQELERETLFARLDRLRFRIALHRALAGGFQLERETP